MCYRVISAKPNIVFDTLNLFDLNSVFPTHSPTCPVPTKKHLLPASPTNLCTNSAWSVQLIASQDLPWLRSAQVPFTCPFPRRMAQECLTALSQHSWTTLDCAVEVIGQITYITIPNCFRRAFQVFSNSKCLSCTTENPPDTTGGHF